MRSALLVLLLLTPLAAAHGAPEAREIDLRILADTTSSGDYGGGEAGLGNGALDLLALDIFEGTVPGTIQPAVVFRLIVQGGSAGSHTIDITGSADGQPFALDLATDDLATYTSTTFIALRGPFDVGDGHVQAIEGVAAMATLGISPGDQLDDIRVTSRVDGDAEDIMPGSWYLGGQTVPLPPSESAGEPGAYETTGPAAFFMAEADVISVPAGEANFTFNVTSRIDSMAQVVTVSVDAPDGVNASAPAILSVAPGATSSATVQVSGLGVGAIKLLLESDLGSGLLLSVPIDSSANFGNGGEVASGDMFAGDSFQYTFTDASTFEYHCHPHPWMQATVTIVEADNATIAQTHVVRIIEADAAEPNSWVFEPAALEIAEGDTVLWINDGSMLHDIRGSTGLGTGGHHHDHDHDHGEVPTTDKDSPGPLFLLPLLVAFWLARRT